MFANLMVLTMVILIHGFIIRYLFKRKDACATCPLRTDVLQELRSQLK